MKKTIIITAAAAAFCAIGAGAQSWLTPEVDKQAKEILSKMTDSEKLEFVGGVDAMYIRDIPRLGVRRMKMSDGPQGLGTHSLSTAYPATIMLTATWNEDLAREYGRSLGRDARARGVDILLGPAVNIYRAPMCGRNFEYMGEDPYLASRTAVNYIDGVQSQEVMATIKHFFGNNSDYDRHKISNDIDERTINEIYFPAFKAAVQEAESGALMTSYNLVDGVYTTESPWLLKDVLRDKWGFKGVVMSDWGATHHCLPAVDGGLDLEMPDAKYMNPADLAYHIKTGHISMKQIDEKVLNILRPAIAFGALENRGADKSIPLDDPESVATALKVAQEGMVLLKNSKNILPLNAKKYKKIMVTGKNATGYVRGGGSGNVNPIHYVSAFDGIKAACEARGIEVELIDELDYRPDIMRSGKDLADKGLKAEYFGNMRLEGKPVGTATENKILYSWGNGPEIAGMPAQQYSVRWSGTVVPDVTGEYVFTVGADDGYRFMLGGETLVDDWKNGAFRSKTFRKHLEAGKKYDICLEYYQDGGSAAVQLTWDRIGNNDRRLEKKLSEADLIVACIGHNSDSEAEDSDRSFELPASDAALMSSLTKCRRPVVAVVNAGGAVEMQSWEPTVNALLWNWYAGQESGRALAEVLFGEVNPSGKLPVTFEKRWEDNPAYNSYHDPDGDKHVAYTEGIFTGYRGYDKLGREVQYPFGYGLSYTTFRLSDVKVSAPDANGCVEVSCRLTNTGKRAGAEVVQAYVGKDASDQAKAERPVKELRGYKKVYLEPGKSAVVTMTLPASSFEYYDVEKHDFTRDPGLYNIMLGFSSRDIKASRQLTVK